MGRRSTSPAFIVTESDDIRVDGAPLARRRESARGSSCSAAARPGDDGARSRRAADNFLEALPEGAPRLVAVGRLDINTEGLLLLTNDGGLARVLELPATGWLRRYRVRAHGAVDQAALDGLAGGVTIDGVAYAGIEAKLDRAQGSNVWLMMGLREGKNREIKRVLEHLGLSVNRLIRISFGPFQLGEMEEGGLAETPTRVLREQIGPRLARESGADFDAPLREVRRVNDRERPSREARVASASVRDRRARAKMRPNAQARVAMEVPSGRRRRAAGSRFEERDGAPRREARPERKRKYFAALRDEREDAGRGPRRRIERTARPAIAKDGRSPSSASSPAARAQEPGQGQRPSAFPADATAIA